MSCRFFAWFVTLGLLLASAYPASARKWTDKTGKFSVEADLVRLKDGKVSLSKSDEKVITVPLDRLSAADRRYLATLNASPTKEPVRPAPEVIAASERAGAVSAEDKPTKKSTGASFPVTGKTTPGVALLDQVMLKYLEKIGCSTATLALSYKGVLVHSRGYGWIDEDRTVPAPPDTMIGIASCDKPITAAAIRQLARNRRLNLDASPFKVLKIEPQGKIVDGRVSDITIRHLLDHKAGWQGEPFDLAVKAARAQGHKDPIALETLLGFIMVQKLKDAPGTRFEYNNFCYDTLRHVIAKVTGRTQIEYFRQSLFRPFGMKELKGFQEPDASEEKPDLPLVWNAQDGGPVSASAPALCAFMRYFWLTGEPRDKSNPLWRMDGSLPASTAMMLWRSDGIDVAFIFNGRENTSHNEIVNELEMAIERLKQ